MARSPKKVWRDLDVGTRTALLITGAIVVAVLFLSAGLAVVLWKESRHSRDTLEVLSNVVDRNMWSRDVFPDAVFELNSLDDVVDQRVAGEPAPSLLC